MPQNLGIQSRQCSRVWALVRLNFAAALMSAAPAPSSKHRLSSAPRPTLWTLQLSFGWCQDLLPYTRRRGT